MGLIVVPGETSNELRLDGPIDIGCAAELKTLLTEAVASGRGLKVWLAGITELDVTGVQLLWAAQRATRKSGVEFAWMDTAPEAMLSVLERLGIEDFTGPDNAVQSSGVVSCQP